jgi:hypothetical protein
MLQAALPETIDVLVIDAVLASAGSLFAHRGGSESKGSGK